MATPSRPSGFGASSTPAPAKKKAAKKPSAARSAAAEAKKAIRERKKAERKEYRRFTVTTRQRRLNWTIGVGSVVALVILVIILTTSPIMSLRTIRVEGVNRLTNAEVVEQLQPLAGLPLARISAGDVARELSDVPLIQSVDTRVELPDTLAVSIIERTPLAVVSTPTGFDVVDQAGVVLWSDTIRPTEFPLVGIAPNAESKGFQAIVSALAAIPSDVLRRIEQITASSTDTVAFSLRDSNHQVLWGSSEFSAQKARALPAALQAAGSGGAKLIDLSTPETVVIRDAN
jgi:cell division protein FtsQ